MLLSEVFKNKIEWSWTTDPVGKSEFEVAFFNIGDIRYAVKAFQAHIGEVDDLRIYFKVNPSIEIFNWIQKHSTHMMSFSADGSYDITKTGNQYQVFATMSDIIPAYMKQTHCDILLFTAAEQSRRRLYNRMVTTIHVPGLVGVRLGERVFAVVRTNVAKELKTENM